jgi:hypothetical protein
MFNRVQRNFKKNMKEIERERSRIKDKDVVFSYIEGDFVDYYTSPQKRKGKSIVNYLSVSISVILGIVLFGGIVLYLKDRSPSTNWTFISKSAIKTIPTPVMNPGNSTNSTSSTINPLLGKIHDFLQYTSSQDPKIRQSLEFISQHYGNAWKESAAKEQFLKTTLTYQDEINKVIQLTLETDCPVELSEFRQSIIAQYKYASDAIISSRNAVLNLDSQSDSQYRFYVNRYNIQAGQRIVDLTNAFDKAKIKWTKNEDGTITYSIQH